jgi:uncharacterized surface protein with fasciclin (FAS1) repeats
MLLKGLTVATVLGFASGQTTPDIPGASNQQEITTVLENVPELSNFTAYLSQFNDLVNQINSQGNVTVLAPNNAAFAQAPDSVWTGDVTTLRRAALAYHVLNGTYLEFTEAGFIPTLLRDTEFANVSGGQVVEVNPTEFGPTFSSGLLQNATTVGAPIEFVGGVIHIIDNIFLIPQNFSTTQVQANLTSAAGAWIAAGVIDDVNNVQDVTLFVPNNAAFQAVGNALSNFNSGQVSLILNYHIISGDVVYSNDLSDNTPSTEAGVDVLINVVDGEIFVNSARVVLSDLLIANGVAHVIDGVLNPLNVTTNFDPNASIQPPAFAGASDTGELPPTSTLPAPSPSTSETSSDSDSGSGTNIGAIVGGVVGGVGGIALIIILLWFIRRQRQRKSPQIAAQQQEQKDGQFERAQLHGDDLKPDRKELSGTAASYQMLEKPGTVSELPANEGVMKRDGGLAEVPSDRSEGAGIRSELDT